MFLERKERMNKTSNRTHCQSHPSGSVSQDRDLSGEHVGARRTPDAVYERPSS